MNRSSWTFHEWTLLLDYLKVHTVSEKFLEEVSQKKLDYQKGLQDKLITPLYDCVNHMVRRSIDDFEREFKYIMESGELEFLDLSFQKFRAELHKCLFFENMELFPQDVRRHLAETVRNSIENQWKIQLERSVYEAVLENGDPSLEDLLYVLKKERIF
ncbi:MAG: hypothetical protein PUG60_07345 [Lachnospiraceae bacterium]|nr:hypothetical protein [Lachnospiraceae bacterium]